MYHKYYVLLKRRKTMAGCTLAAGVMLLFLTMAVRRNHANDGGADGPGQYFV